MIGAKGNGEKFRAQDAPNIAGGGFPSAVGPPPINYRWLKNGNPLWDGGNLAGAGSPTFILSNASGSVTSQIAVLSVVDPLLTNQPRSQATSAGQTITASIGDLVTVLVTNTIPVFETNLMPVAITNFVAKPGVVATIEATGGVVNTFLPGVGSILALALGGLYHGYRQVRNRKVNAALVQGVETARAILETTPQGQTADAQFVKWLKDHQKEAGVFTTVAGLVENLSDNEAAKLTAQEIAERVRLAGQGTATPAVAA